MIAKRPERSNVSENELFAGMTFPEVPRGPILVKPTSSDQPHYTQNIELTTMEKKNVHEELDISQFLEENETTSLIQKDKTDSLRFQTNFSTLYRIEDTKPESAKYYPELPQLTSVKQPIPKVELQQVGETVKNDSDLVENLIQENSKLRNELADLRMLLTEKTGSTETSQTQNNSISSDTKTQHTGNMKYVCCGSCKQWLVAPKASTYVICSNCKAVNNCNLVQGTQVHTDNTNNQSTNLNQSNSWVPWFMECFTPSFS